MQQSLSRRIRSGNRNDLNTTPPGGVVLQTWVPPDLADQVKEHAQPEQRSVSSTIRNAIIDQLREPGKRP